MNQNIIPAITAFLESGKEDEFPKIANLLDRDDRRDFLAARDALQKDQCPDCSTPLDHGTWIPTMTSCYECLDCDFSIEYQEN
jgi:hypothetical protein